MSAEQLLQRLRHVQEAATGIYCSIDILTGLAGKLEHGEISSGDAANVCRLLNNSVCGYRHEIERAAQDIGELLGGSTGLERSKEALAKVRKIIEQGGRS